MNFYDVEAAIKARVETEWTNPYVPVYFANELHQRVDEYIDAVVLTESTEGLGWSGTHVVSDKRNGIIQFNIYTLTGTGSGSFNKLSVAMAALFNRTSFDGIVCQTANIIGGLGIVENKAAGVLEVPFYWYDNSQVTIV